MNNKIALVTGGSRGLGKNMTLQLADKGSDVIVTYNSKKEAALEVVKEIEGRGRRAATLHLNVGETKSFDGFIERVSQILKEKWEQDTFDFLINNAGVGGNASIAAHELACQRGHRHHRDEMEESIQAEDGKHKPPVNNSY